MKVKSIRVSESIGPNFGSDVIRVAGVKRVVRQSAAVLFDAQNFAAEIVQILCPEGIQVDTAEIRAVPDSHIELAVRSKAQASNGMSD